MSFTRWLIPLPAILFAVIPQNANAEPILGLNTTYYTIDVIPPVQSTSEYPVCGTETENNINRSYDGEPYEDCTYDLFMVHITGYITIPEHDTIEFMIASDDGGEITIDSNTFGVWYDQGCTWTESGPLELDAASVPLELFMYENGGGTCLMLAWNIDNTGWAIVPDEAFTTNAISTTTTTTTVQETTTTWVPSTTSTTTTTTSTTIAESTTVPATTTTVTLPISTTTTTEPVQTSTTTSTTSTTVAPTTTTEPPYTPPQTSTTVPEPKSESSPTNETQPETTTTEPATTIDEPETTEPETSTTVPDETLPEPVEPDETTIPETSVPEILDEPVLDETEQPTDTTEPQEYTTETTLIQETDSSTTSVLFLEDELIDDEQFSAIIESIDKASSEQIVAIIETVLAADITSEQAAELVSNVAVLQVITESEAEQLFSEVVPAELSEEQAALIVEAVQSAPKEVREAFEAVIDIFGSQFENYVPTGSNIPVSQRRTLVAIGATLTMLPAPRVKR